MCIFYYICISSEFSRKLMIKYYFTKIYWWAIVSHIYLKSPSPHDSVNYTQYSLEYHSLIFLEYNLNTAILFGFVLTSCSNYYYAY